MEALVGLMTGASSAQTAVCVAVEGRGIVGGLVLTDELRPDARWTVAELSSRLGCRVLVLSGDR